MTCKEFSGRIPDFLRDRLDNAELRAFLEHLETCHSCREELEIQYLMDRVFSREEKNWEINLTEDLPAYIVSERSRMKKRTRLARTAFILEGITILVCAGAALLMLH